MATSTYSALLTRIAGLANRSDLTTLIPDWIGDFEAKANRWMRERRMTGRATASISTEYATIPADFAEMVSYAMTDGSETWTLTPTPPKVMDDYAAEEQTGKPQFYSIVGGEFRHYPVPSATYMATTTYLQKLEALSGSNADNWLLLDAPDAYVQGTMAGYHEWNKDYDASDRAMAKAEQVFQELLMARRTPVGPLRVDELTALAPRRGYDINRDY